MWDTLFAVANVVDLIAWAALILLPRWPALLSALLFIGVGGLCLAYSVTAVALFGGLADPVRDAGAPAAVLTDYSIDGLKALFASRGAIALGRIHYLAFDLFVGLWIARDADGKGFARWVQAPILLLTFLAGPIGLLLWLIVRERRARALGRPQ